MPQISVIVPVYKVEPYLRRCVDSILGQSFTDFELILVDDGSPDNCGAICDEYAAKDSRVRVIHKENGGLSSARNAGLDVAQGDYILFCDSDDYVAPEWCMTMWTYAVRYPGAFVVSNLMKVCGEKETPYRLKEENFREVSYFELYKYGVSPYAVNKIYDNDNIQKYQLRFDEECVFAEDVSFTARYCGLCQKIVFISLPLYYYVQNSGSIMHRYYRNLFSLHLPLFSLRLPLLKDQEIEEYCDIWLYQFLQLFENVFDSRNTMSFWQKLRYNQQMINSDEFRYCLNHASGENENPLVIKMLRMHNYYLFWIFTKVVRLKRKIKEALA